MNISELFIRKPVATTLLTVAIALAGVVAFQLLPVSPRPQVDFPTISVSAALPGASPETMASSVATPLERQFGRIASVTEMTSSSGLGSTSITLQFELTRNIDAAARDVESAINAARGYLPINLPANPSYRKVNPADSPIFILGLTSKVLSKGQMYDAASTVMAQKLSQISGVGQVSVGGSALPSVRIELNLSVLNKYGISFESVRSALGGANANVPKGHFTDGPNMWEVGANDQILKAVDYEPLVIAYRNGVAVRVSDVGQAVDSVEDLRQAGYLNSQPAVLMIVFRQPGANIIQTVDRIRAALPQLEGAIPRAIQLTVAVDQTVTIRASVSDVERTLVISVLLVILVVFFFLRNVRTTFIPSVAVPVSLIGTFGAMYLLGYSVDNLSLMALTISTGFVVDDAIVVIENITRYLEKGMKPFEAALKGAREIGFTVLTISFSLIAVFIPLLLMSGIVGRLFREFAVTLSVAILISMAISLTATPMMCAHLLKERQSHGWFYRTSERFFNAVIAAYGRTLNTVLDYAPITLTILLATIGLTVYLFIRVPKGFFPEQDNGRIQGSVLADQDTSFQALDKTLLSMTDIVKADPGVENALGFTGGANTARMFISLKPLNERKLTAQQIITRLRPKLAKVPGASLYLQAAQDVRVGGRQSNAEYQFTMQGDNLPDLVNYSPKMLEKLKAIHVISDVNSDLQNQGLQAMVTYDRKTAARFNIAPQLIDDTLYDAFGQRQVSTMYTSLNQYHVVMEAAPQFWQNPQFLREVYVSAPGGRQVPLSALAAYEPETAPLTVAHQGLFPAVTISFNLAPNASLGDAVNDIQKAALTIGLPRTIHTVFAGTAQAYQDSLASEPLLIAAALITVYLVLGILYESVVHPVTILSTIPSAGVGGLLALFLTNTDLTIIAIIGLILLIGIVKKNAHHDDRFRAGGRARRGEKFARFDLRGLHAPSASDSDDDDGGDAGRAAAGARDRHRVGIAASAGNHHHRRADRGGQMLTLYTTPVVYLYFDKLQHWREGARTRAEARRSGLATES